MQKVLGIYTKGAYKNGCYLPMNCLISMKFVHNEIRNRFMGKLFPLLPCFTTNKDEIHEERLIANDCFSVT